MSRVLNLESMKFFPEPGESLDTASRQLITYARINHCRCVMVFNGIELEATEVSTVSEIFQRFNTEMDERRVQYLTSDEGRKREREKEEQILVKQGAISYLMKNLPSSKIDAMSWIRDWVLLADHVGVVCDKIEVCHMLQSLGFVRNAHVCDPELAQNTASIMKRAEYIGGQVIDMIIGVGCVHPMISEWADDVASASSGSNHD